MDRIWRDDILWEAWRRVKRNRGSAGVDSETLAEIEQRGVDTCLAELGAALRAGTLRRRESGSAWCWPDSGWSCIREKTRVVDLTGGREGLDFLGCHLRKRMNGPIWVRKRRRVGIRGWCMPRPEVHLESRVRGIRMRGLNGGLAFSWSVPPMMPSEVHLCACA